MIHDDIDVLMNYGLFVPLSLFGGKSPFAFVFLGKYLCKYLFEVRLFHDSLE